MIGEILISNNPSFDHICAYVAREEKEGEILAVNGVRDTSAADMAEDFDVQRELRPKLGRAVMHVALAWPPEEKAMSNALMLELTLAWMKEMKIDPENTQWSLTRHSDKKHPHGHLIINRVDNDGAVVSDQKNYDKSMAACRKLEKQYGLVNAKEAGQDSRRAAPEKLKGRDVLKLYVQDSESRQKPLAAWPQEMLAGMKADGIKSQATYGPDGKLRNVVYEYQGHHFKGSELGRECSGGNVAKTIDAQRDTVLAARVVLGQFAQQYGQVGAELGTFFVEYGEQKQANEKTEKAEKAEKQALEQKQADEKAQREADEKAAQREVAQKQADEKAEKQAQEQKQANEKAEKQAQEQRQRELSREIQRPTPTIEQSGEIEI